VRSADWRTAMPTTTRVGDGVRPRFGALGAFHSVSQPTYEPRLAIDGTVQVMRHNGPNGQNTKVFAATQYQGDP
jgi:hypothetical protein